MFGKKKHQPLTKVEIAFLKGLHVACSTVMALGKPADAIELARELGVSSAMAKQLDMPRYDIEKLEEMEKANAQ